jgi:hypothetical protein
MTRLLRRLIPFATLAFLPGCGGGDGYEINTHRIGLPQSEIDARLAAADRCEGLGLKIPSEAYSKCFFSGLHQNAAATGSADQSGLTVPPPQEAPSQVNSPPEQGLTSEIPLRRVGDTYFIPVSINGRLTLDFVVDSGASDVSIPADVILTLMRTGTIQEADFIGKQSYRLADGSVVPSITFRIRSLKVGDHEIGNVLGSVAPLSGALLLGQSFLGRFKSWSIDNNRHVLRLD